MKDYENDEEKESAFRGLCNMVAADRDVIREDLFYFCDAVTSWVNPPSDLKEEFTEVYFLQ